MNESSTKVVFVGINGRDLAYTRVRCYGFAKLLGECGIPAEVFTLQETYCPGTQPDHMLVLPKAERLKLTFRAIARLWREKGAVFYIQKAHYHAAAPFLLCRLGRNRFILDYDDWDLDRSPFLDIPVLDRCVFGSSGAEEITARLARSASACVASTAPLQHLLSQYNRRTYLVPTAVDTDHFSPPQRPPSGAVTFVWTGMVWGKVMFDSVMFAVDCFTDVHRAFPGTRLLIAGKGGWWEQMKKAIAAAYAGFPIGVRDWVPPAEMPSFLAQAHVGLLPLIPDGTNDDWMRCKCPTKLFEFMAMEMPTVASAYGEVRGIISDGEDGLLAGDRNEFIERMRLLAGDAELRARMGKRARESAVSRYSLHGQRDILRDIVRSVAERHESVGPVVGGKA